AVAVLLVAGVVVTGTGPHSGDEAASRFAFDIETVARIHADVVYVVVGLTFALLFALRPDWTPGQIKSALVTTARTSVTKQDRLTPADPFDVGGGRVDLTRAGDPGLTLSESARNFAASAADEPNRVDLNLPSVNAPVMPGVLTVRRTVTNVTNRTLVYRATGTTVSGASVTVLPPILSVRPGRSAKISVVIAAPELPDGQYFGRVDLKEIGGDRDLRLPVAFFRRQGAVPVGQDCAPAA
ncbi:hypothetical protein ACFQ08_41920, partial [Streptosporangium algeriense]